MPCGPRSATLSTTIAVLAVLVVAEGERVQPAVRVEALARVGYVVWRVGRKDTLDQFVRQRLAVRRELGYCNSRKRTVSSLELDLSLNWSLFQKRLLHSPGIEAAEEALSEQELAAIKVARQPGAPVPTLVAIDLRPAEGCPFAALPAETQVQVRTR